MTYFKFLVGLITFITLTSCTKSPSLDVLYKVIAHRGCWYEFNTAQNSLDGLFYAFQADIDGVELDVCKTVDDIIVVAHGDMHGPYIISQTKYSILKEIRLCNGEILPTLNEYLSYYKEFGANIDLIIEIKQPGEEELVIKIVEQFDILDNVKFISFFWDICKNIKRVNPDIHISYINGDKSPLDIKNEGLSGMAYKISVYKNNMEWLEEARLHGITTYVWDVNTEDDFAWCTQNKLEYVVTDNPISAMNYINN